MFTYPILTLSYSIGTLHGQTSSGAFAAAAREPRVRNLPLVCALPPLKTFMFPKVTMSLAPTYEN